MESRSALALTMTVGLLGAGAVTGWAANVSDASVTCVACHSAIHPGLVSDWSQSHHGTVSSAEALKKPAPQRRVSVAQPPAGLADHAVGCAECHTMNPDRHPDTFDHYGARVHVVVTPEDCATCHPTEVQQYGQNLMSHAYGNLENNPAFHGLADTVAGSLSFADGRIALTPPSPETAAEACLHCHGTKVEVQGTTTRSTIVGDIQVPVLSGWPNQGSGRVNPDGSRGACTACHTRHRFSIEMARKPYTCAQCHKGPDVPAFAVYEVSKHGSIFSAMQREWNFTNVPWVVGADLGAPTCATCHVSMLASEDGTVLTERTHQMSDRQSWRLFGLIYGHPHPRSPDTTTARNSTGQSLPTELTGEPVADYVIGPEEQATRRANMTKVCAACHDGGVIAEHFARLDNTIGTTNQATLAATQIVLEAWARGLADTQSPFNEAIEKRWVEQWLFYANSTRFASAMGGADYGVFASGRWYLTRNAEEMAEWLRQHQTPPATASRPEAPPSQVPHTPARLRLGPNHQGLPDGR